jgi:predicted CXXCH cytochrome family protein
MLACAFGLNRPLFRYALFGGFLGGAVGVPLSGLAAPSHPTAHHWDRLRYGPGDINHSVLVVPSASVEIPEGWPVDHAGRITCLTCHSAIPTSGDLRLRSVGDGGFDPSTFCRTCHDNASASSGPAMHWRAMGRAHVRFDADRGERATGNLDGASRRCLGCHDGLSASETPHGTGSQAAFDMSNPARNHPVGIPYGRGGVRGRTMPLRSPQLLPDRIRLPGGRVSCVSCHDLYSQTPKRLAMSNDGSRLCMTCHAMD